LLAPAVPVTVGTPALVMPSPGVPLSLPEERTGTGGAVGPVRAPATMMGSMAKVAVSIPSVPWMALVSLPPVGSVYENWTRLPVASAAPSKLTCTVLPVPSTVTPVMETSVPSTWTSKALVGGGCAASSATSKFIVMNCSPVKTLVLT
jgi:hypothetical protein